MKFDQSPRLVESPLASDDFPNLNSQENLCDMTAANLIAPPLE